MRSGELVADARRKRRATAALPLVEAKIRSAHFSGNPTFQMG
jgi:hypothetical protein